MSQFFEILYLIKYRSLGIIKSEINIVYYTISKSIILILM